MPTFAVHIDVADEVGRRCGADGTLPIDWRAPGTRDAFLLGSVAPDMGLYPGGAPLLSDLSHHARPADLLRSLLDCAVTDAQRAYAWGWLTHILVDVRMHPLIDACATALEDERPSTGGLADRDRAFDVAHARVELGLDVWWLCRRPVLARIRLAASPPSEATRIAECYRSVYGCRVDAAEVDRSHRAIARWDGPLIHLCGLLAADWHAPRNRQSKRLAAARALIRSLYWAPGPTSYVHGFLHPIRPDARLREALRWLHREILTEFRRHAGTDLRDLPNLDLGTGRPAGEVPCMMPRTLNRRARDSAELERRPA